MNEERKRLASWLVPTLRIGSFGVFFVTSLLVATKLTSRWPAIVAIPLSIVCAIVAAHFASRLFFMNGFLARLNGYEVCLDCECDLPGQYGQRCPECQAKYEARRNSGD